MMPVVLLHLTGSGWDDILIAAFVLVVVAITTMLTWNRTK